MAGTFTKIPTKTFDDLQTDAGVVLKNFNPSEPALLDGDIICATTGRISISCVPTFSDMGEDIDNCPNGMLELMNVDGYDCKMSFTSLGVTEDTIKLSLGAADSVDGKIIPRKTLDKGDFGSVWWVGDKKNGGMIAVHLMMALSTGGFSLQTTKNGKGQLAIELTGHVSINAQDIVPMEIYVSDEPTATTQGVDGGETLPTEPTEEPTEE